MLTETTDYDTLYRDFRWEIPARFNIATACCDRHADGSGEEVLHRQPGHLGGEAQRRLTGVRLPVGVGDERDRRVERHPPRHARQAAVHRQRGLADQHGHQADDADQAEADDARGIGPRALLGVGVDAGRSATRITVLAPDRPGLLHGVVTAISASGGNIIDARVYTSAGGRALDNLLVQKLDGSAFDEPQHLERLTAAVRDAVDGEVTPLHPASIAQLHASCTLYLDPPAASLLASRGGLLAPRGG